VIDAICDLFSPSSIFDVGCGNGLYLHEAARRGIYAAGCDGSEVGVRLCPPDILVFLHDLRRPLIVSRPFDCCISFEVAEHIPKKYSEVLVDSCAGLSDLVLFSSAHPGQTDGEDHINLQPERFWDRLFAKKGLIRDESLTQSLRTRWGSNNVIQWLVENTRVYRRAAGSR
jgi:2-polyprenyl-3-methyl-5-hydroxy-6-metoxy-1,4-benzoquinol methylase